MFLFWFLVVLSVYFEIFCYKICFKNEKIVEKMWKNYKKIAFPKCYQTPENRFLEYFLLQNQTPGFHFPYRNSLSPTFILHSEFDLHRTKCSLKEWRILTIRNSPQKWPEIIHNGASNSRGYSLNQLRTQQLEHLVPQSHV